MSETQDDPYSILLMGFGQSNADIHDAGPRIYPETDQNIEVYMPNDARGFRGWGYRKQETPITGFIPISEASPKIQSLLTAAAGHMLHESRDDALSRIIVRSGAVGGRRFHAIVKEDRKIPGIYTDVDGESSLIFLQFFDTIRQCVETSRNDPAPIKKVYVVWMHGESDRVMPREQYRDTLLSLMRETETELAEIGVEINWALVQPSGSGDRGNGNAWPNRLSLFDVANVTDNAFIPAAAYAYEMFDGSHFSGQGKLLLGEMLGRQITKHLQGRFEPLPLPERMTVDGTQAQIFFPENVRLALETEALLPPGPGMGFGVNLGTRCSIERVELTAPNCVNLHFDTAPDPETLIVTYAYILNRKNLTNVAVSDYPVGRGGLRLADEIRSSLHSETVLYDWIPGFTISASGGVNPE